MTFGTPTEAVNGTEETKTNEASAGARLGAAANAAKQRSPDHQQGVGRS